MYLCVYVCRYLCMYTFFMQVTDCVAFLLRLPLYPEKKGTWPLDLWPSKGKTLSHVDVPRNFTAVFGVEKLEKLPENHWSVVIGHDCEWEFRSLPGLSVSTLTCSKGGEMGCATRNEWRLVPVHEVQHELSMHDLALQVQEWIDFNSQDTAAPIAWHDERQMLRSIQQSGGALSLAKNMKPRNLFAKI